MGTGSGSRRSVDTNNLPRETLMAEFARSLQADATCSGAGGVGAQAVDEFCRVLPGVPGHARSPDEPRVACGREPVVTCGAGARGPDTVVALRAGGRSARKWSCLGRALSLPAEPARRLYLPVVWIHGQLGHDRRCVAGKGTDCSKLAGARVGSSPRTLARV